MKRVLAMLLAGCMLVQSLPGSAVMALGAEEDGVITLTDDGGAAADIPADDTFTADPGGIVDIGGIEEITPDISAVPDNSGEDSSQTLPADEGTGAISDGSSSDILISGDGIIDDIEIVTPVGENAVGTETDEQTGEESEPGNEAESGDFLEWELVEASDDAGMISDTPAVSQAVTQSYIEVKVVSGQLFIPEGGLTVRVGVSSLNDKEVDFEEKTFSALGETQTFEFPVDPGEYKVTVNAPRYACYEQTVKAEASRRSKICVSTARTAETGTAENEKKSAVSGWLRLGDVVENEAVDEADVNAILADIRDEVTDPGAPTNLNEGLEDTEKVDIADLQIAIQNKSKAEQKSSVEMQQIPLPPETEAGTQVKGELNDLISGKDKDGNNASVELKPEEGKTISPETPVAISFPLAPEGTKDEDLPKLEGMTIQAPITAAPEEGSGEVQKTGSAIASGWVEVEAVDETGKPVVYLVKMTDDTVLDNSATQPAAVSSGEQPADISEAGLEDEGQASADMISEAADIVVISDEAVPRSDASVIEDADVTVVLDTPDAPEAADVEAGAAEDAAAPEDAGIVISGSEGIAEIVSVEPTDAAAGEAAPASEVAGAESEEIAPASETAGTEPEDAAPASEAADLELSGNEDAVSVSDATELQPAGAEPQPAEEPQPERIVMGSAKVASDGSIVMDFGKQVAVKKVTIKISGTTKKEDNLVNISKVEFVNDMANRIPEPEMNIPQLTLTPGNEEILVTWKEETNVTGYELEISGEVKKAGQQMQAVLVSGTKHTFTGINNNDLRNFRPYKIRARSLNGEWRSEWSEWKEATPKPDARPEPVDNLKIKAGYRSLSLNWKDMDDASGYMVFYRADSEADFRPVVEGSGTYQPADNSEAEVNKSGAGRIETNSYTLTGLEDNTLYWVYVIGWNELGWGKHNNDRIVSEKTDSKARPQLPKFHAINLPETDDESAIGKLTPHIESADCSKYDANPNNNSEEKDKGKSPRMVDSKLDGCVAEEGDTTRKETNSALGVVDNDYDSYWQKYDWDEGYVYGGYGIHVKLDKAYKMSYLTYSACNIEKEFAGGYVERARIYYRDTTENPDAEQKEVLAYVSRKYDANDQLYYLVKFQEAIEANEIRLCLGRGYGDLWMRVGEMRFHECDEVYDGIMGLFADEMHSSLREDVTEKELAALEEELETTDHGEKHPLYDSLQLELKLAKELFADRDKEQTILKVDTRLTTNSDGHLKFGGLNAWQPLGRVAAKGETMVIYVGHNTKRAEEASNLQVVFTQYHAQSNELNYTVNLKVGRNEITVPSVTNENRERGGQIYIQYTGARNSTDKYEVRALGGQKIPVLNIYKMQPGAEKTAAIEEYVKELDEYVKTIKTTHDSLRQAGEETAVNAAWKSNIDFDYTDRNCLLNATDLMMDYMMYSVPALQVWKGITDGADVSKSLSDAEVTAAAKKLETSLNAMEDAMKLFYQHKGLSDDPKAVSSEERGSNEMPVKHLNIRYMQMFAGAFMYASGNHIGVEYPETNVAGGAASWDSFGWGIGHEIGHDINQSWYAIAEITNNYFAQLLTKAYNGTRFKYEIDPEEGDAANDIYSKVTSGALGRSANGAVQLGLYWQLHLAFDNYTINNKGMTNNTLNDTTSKVSSYPYKDDRYVFNDYDEQFNNLFFARVDTYGRNPSKAPHGGVTLASGADAVDQNLMRLSCAAANANILSFFERWGMVPDEGTLAYAANFEKTEKALYYVNDDARDYRAAHTDEAGSITGQDVIESASASAEGNKVSITVTPKASVNGEVLLGYEIIRGMYSNGKIKKDVVGFKLADGSKPVTYIDEIATINNRVMYYEVKAVDQYLNYSNVADAGSVKIQTNGALAKSEWTIETTMTSTDDVALNPNPSFAVEPDAYVDNGKDDPDGGFTSDLHKVKDNAKKVEHSIDKIADGSANTVYTGTEGTNAGITIDMHDFCEVTSLIYRGDELGTVTVSVSTDNANWTDVKNIDMAQITANEDGSKTIWFDSVSDDPEIRAAWIGTYEARYVKLAFSKAGAVKINEIDICGPTGDNLEFEKADGEEAADSNVIGVLKEDYTYSNGKDNLPGTEDDDKIPAGSLIFTGRYKGNPAYNVVILYDEGGNVIGAHEKEDGTTAVESQQVIFAEVPAHGELGETSDGIWVYYLEPEIWKDEASWKATVNGGIRGELYRVDNAHTNAGERIVSDTKIIKLPETLPEIAITGGSIPGSGAQQ